MAEQSLEVRRGAQLAIDLLDELESDTELCDSCTIEAPVTTGAPQHNIIRPYLERAQAAGPDVLEGFTLILSCFVASVTSGTCPGADFYRARFRWNRKLARQYAQDGYRAGEEVANG